MSRTILVTGASGFLGWHFCRHAAESHQVCGVVHSHPVEIPDVRMYQGDLSDPRFAKYVLSEVKPWAVFHLAAISQPNDCERDPDFSRKINVDTSVDLARHCRDQGIQFVFTSSDQVFDGQSAPYREEDAPFPVNEYGRQKRVVEQFLLAEFPKALVCRMPLMFGEPGPAAGNFLPAWLESMRTAKALKLFTDEIRTPVSGMTAAGGLLLALEKQLRGIIHLGGKQRISRYELGILIAECAGLTQTAVLEPSSQNEVQTPAPRPADVSMDSSKAFSSGYNPGTIQEELIRALNM